jgi:hypothetical protein
LGAGREVKLISHRGNISGPNTDRENSPEYLNEALDLGYDVEIDLWLMEGSLFLGHDMLEYEISERYLNTIRDHAWIHCKNLLALDFCRRSDYYNCFSHSEDDAVLTSKGFIWAYPGKEIKSDKCVVVLPERGEQYKNLRIPNSFYGVCSDYIEQVDIVK